MKSIFTLLFLCFVFLLTAQNNSQNTDWYTVGRFNDTGNFPKYIEFNTNEITFDNFLLKINKIKGFENIQFRFTGTERDTERNNHYRFIQVVNGMDMIGSMLIAHEKESRIISCNGDVFDAPKFSTVSYTGETALQKILSINKNTEYFFQRSDMISSEIASPPKPYLAVLPSVLNRLNHTSCIVYAIDLYASEPLSRKVYYVDANTLEILFIEDKIETVDVPGKTNTKYSGIQNIITDSVQLGVFHLRESQRGIGNGVQTYNMLKGTVYSTATNFTDTDNFWNNVNVNLDEVAGDIHWGAEMTYDFYKNVLNRNSIDNNGFKLISYVHYSTNYVNAFWNGYFMTYGDGGSGYLPLASLDVCGHEITHGLTQKTAALIYSNESGALNESFSDIFGVSIDFYTRPAQANFRIGEQFGPGGAGLRDMSDPKIYGNPSTYKGQFWVSDKSDNGGVHYNSGVQNKWFYLLCKGDTGSNDKGIRYKVDSIGLLKSIQIAYKSLTTFLTPLSNYNDARFYSILAAEQLYGDCSNEVSQVINAWSAVGMGDTSGLLVRSNFTTSKNSSCSIPFDVQFYNNSLNANGYFWDFGDGFTSTQINPKHTYSFFGNFNVKLVAKACNGVDMDSTTQFQLVKIDANLSECKLTVMPVSGIGATLTACSGTLRDDGDTSNYGNLIYSVRSIAPANASVLKINFKQFDFENQFDFLYLYDGIDTLGKLIGKYTGNNLPNGGVIYCKSGAVTIRLTSDYLVAGQGFELDWQCIPKTNFDCRLEIANENIIGRKLTHSALLPDQKIALKVTSKGNQLSTTTTLKYKVNNGSISSVNVSLNSGVSNVLLGPFDFSLSGSYTLLVWIEDALDGVKENDTLKINIQQFDNLPVILPFLENFESLGDIWLYKNTSAVNGMSRIDYENTSAQCRLRTNAGNGIVIAGTRSITMDKSDRNWLYDTLPQSNFIVLTYNLSNMNQLNSPLLFRLTYMQHGDKQYPNDAIWERGCDTCAWIKFFDLFLNKAAAGLTKTIPLYNLNYYLDSARQTFSSSFQIRIGQQDQNSTINSIQYTGYTIDNIRLSTWNTGIETQKKNSILTIQPNPSHGIFVVKTEERLRNMQIFDSKGISVWTEKLPQTGFFEMDLSAFAKGIYFAAFYDENNIGHFEKLIVD